MMLNQGKFEINGGCGYLLKPEHMRRSDRTFDPFVESTVDGIIAGTVQIRVISGQCLSERKCSTYVDVEMYGLPADTVRRKYRTKVVSNNGLNPVYDEEPFKFKVILPQLAELRIAAYEDNGKLIGHRVLPVTGLSAGYRHIKLRNESYQPLTLPTLFVDIVTKDYVPENFTYFADALANPMKYLSEKDKRTQQLEALIIEEQEEAAEQAAQQNDLNVPYASEKKRGSIVSIPGNHDKRDKNSYNSKKDNGSHKGNSKEGSRAHSLQIAKSNSVERPPAIPRSQSVTPETSTLDKDESEIKPPTVASLREHKSYLKIKQKHDAELQALVQKHSKDFARINKDLELDAKKMKLILEKEKATIQKKHSKILKKSEKDGAYNEAYNDCLKEINELNTKHETELQSFESEQRLKAKEQFCLYYEEQKSVAKSQVQPKISELRKTLQLCEISDQKKLEEIHVKNMLQLKKDQDKFSRGEVKELARRYKDKSELQKEKRQHNKNHITQSVKERQKLQDYQEVEKEALAKQYEELVKVLDNQEPIDSEELEKNYQTKLKSLDRQDFVNAVPSLFS